jgi:hypothetical protein
VSASRIVVCGAAFVIVATSAAAALQRAPLALKGEGPYYRLPLPAELYTAELGIDLYDLRVRNATGVAVPFAWDQAATAALVQWIKPITPSSCGGDSCDYPLPRNFPLYRLRVMLAQPNTLAQIQVLGLLPAGSPSPVHHPHHHNLLKVLRRHEKPPPAPSPVAGDGLMETQLADAVVYRLVKQGVQERSADVMLDGRAFPTLRLRVRGGIGQLGQPGPRIEVGTLERSVVFLASGPAPFSLTWGASAGDSGAMPMATLIPRYKPAKPPILGTATVDASAVVAVPVPQPVAVRAPSAPALFPPIVAAPVSAAAKPPRDYDPWLWSALAAGVAALGGMVWSLLRAKSSAPCFSTTENRG